MTTWSKEPPKEAGAFWIRRRFHARWKTEVAELRPPKPWQDPAHNVEVRIAGYQKPFRISRRVGEEGLMFWPIPIQPPEEQA